MAAESIATYRKPGFPKIEKSERSTRTRIEYIGPAANLEPAAPDQGDTWGDFLGTVVLTDYQPTENTTQAELVVVCELVESSPENAVGTLESESYEVVWATVSRSLYEHPQFAIGGGGANALTRADITQIDLWQKSLPIYKDAYQWEDPENQSYGGVLSDNAKLFARGLELGQENWDDKAPVAMKTSLYVGGPPDTSTEAGQKTEEPAGFSTLPPGYEWRKDTDDVTNTGSKTRFERSETWLGAKKVLIDRDQVFWEPPA